MAKLSVYVPDDLLERAKQADPDLRPSQVLRSALEDRLPQTQRPYAIVNDYLLAQRAAAQEIVNRRATEAYQEGYKVGLEFATALPWQAFENFAQSGWDLAAWVGTSTARSTTTSRQRTRNALRGKSSSTSQVLWSSQ